VKIVTIVGARPQFIKSSIVSKAIKKFSELKETLIHTGQHFDTNMSNIFFEQFQMHEPLYNLNINNKPQGEMTGLMLDKIEKILMKEKPQGVLVYGDTNSTLAGSLAAVKLNIPIFHVEAGLRSYNRSMPEEINRILTDHISSLLFCPTENAVNILKKEGIKNGVIYSGDVMYDLFINHSSNISVHSNPFVLATIHRPSNTDNPKVLNEIIEALEEINSKIKVILPLHPRTKKKIKKLDISTSFSIIPPLGYKEMIDYLINAELVITDSGGLQKEAFFSKTKCITVRSETEWVELIDSGANILCESSKKAICDAFNNMSLEKCDFSPKYYGKGKAAIKIVKSILSFFDKTIAQN
jgi:UDP-GlcNAc3NAcA epimerase